MRVTASIGTAGTQYTMREGERVVEESIGIQEVNDRRRAASGWSPRATHAIGHIPIRAEDAERVREIGRAARRAYEATPGGALRTLHRRREDLVERVASCADTAASARAAAFDEGELDGHLAPGGPAAGQADREQQARDALARFDVEHPEIRAELQRKRQADIARWSRH
ncbi:hypothetical protein [Embleya sp. NPDC005971]|uniref:hypothetical protein n=1 Tax=Embleya sp. NPDC005971 TaxID=3156724 RepID=UPI0033C0EC75